MKIAICGNYGANNIGDEMILEGLLTSLKEVNKDFDITVLSGNPKQTIEKHKVNSVEKFPSGIKSFIKSFFKITNTKKIVQECDYFILGGGGLFGSLSFKANLIWGMQALKAYSLGKKVIMYGQSIGELNCRISKWLIKKIFNKAYLIVVRDQKSKDRLKSLKINKKIYLLPDLAFNLNPILKPKNEKKKIIIALRQIACINRGFKEGIAKFIDWLIEEGKWEVEMIDFQLKPSPDADFKLHNEILALTKNKNDVIYPVEIKTTEDLFNIFADSDFVLGMRFHSIISAIKTKTPFIAINYAEKIQDLINEIKLNKYLISPKDITFEALKALFEKILKESKEIKEKLKEINDDYLNKHKKFNSLVLNKIFLI